MAGEQWHNFAQYVEPRAEQVDRRGDRRRRRRCRRSPPRARRRTPPGAGTTRRTEGVCYAPATNHAEFHWFPNAADLAADRRSPRSSRRGRSASPSTPRKDRRLVGLTERVAPLRWGYTFLVNKYYLDALYEGVIVHAIAHPIARAANWVNQNVIDAIVNGVGDRRQAGRRVGLPQRRPARRRRRGQPAPASSPRRVARRCAPCSRARSTSTVRCSSGRRPSEPSCS